MIIKRTTYLGICGNSFEQPTHEIDFFKDDKTLPFFSFVVWQPNVISREEKSEKSDDVDEIVIDWIGLAGLNWVWQMFLLTQALQGYSQKQTMRTTQAFCGTTPWEERVLSVDGRVGVGLYCS